FSAHFVYTTSVLTCPIDFSAHFVYTTSFLTCPIDFSAHFLYLTSIQTHSMEFSILLIKKLDLYPNSNPYLFLCIFNCLINFFYILSIFFVSPSQRICQQSFYASSILFNFFYSKV